MGEMHTIEAIRVSRDGTSRVVARLSRRLDRPRLQRIVARLVTTGTFPGYKGPPLGRSVCLIQRAQKYCGGMAGLKARRANRRPKRQANRLQELREPEKINRA